jgi:hypothetical protein
MVVAAVVAAVAMVRGGRVGDSWEDPLCRCSGLHFHRNIPL